MFPLTHLPPKNQLQFPSFIPCQRTSEQRIAGTGYQIDPTSPFSSRACSSATWTTASSFCSITRTFPRWCRAGTWKPGLEENLPETSSLPLIGPHNTYRPCDWSNTLVHKRTSHWWRTRGDRSRAWALLEAADNRSFAQGDQVTLFKRKKMWSKSLVYNSN